MNAQAKTQYALDPRVRWFLDLLRETGRPEVFEITVEEARALNLQGQQLFSVEAPACDLEERAIETGDFGRVPVWIFRPQGAAGVLPAVLYIHGGGWVLGDHEVYDRLMRQLAGGTGAAVVFPEYSRSPEVRYPVALEQVYAVTQWLARHGAEWGLDTSRLVMAGDSAGATMIAGVSLLAEERGGARLAAQALIYPLTDAGFDTGSYEEFAEGYLMSTRAARWFWEQYTSDPEVARRPQACPSQASVEMLKCMPPTLVITAECDLLRDEGEAFARKLMAAGVPVTCTRYLGTIHAFVSINALAETPAARAATAQAIGFLRESLAGA